MSLIITSNIDTDKQEYNNQGITGGLNQPNSYSNTIDDLVIPKNAEIAVQSVKINRQGGISLNQKNNIVGLYLGKSVGNLKTAGNPYSGITIAKAPEDPFEFSGVGMTQSLACPIRGVEGKLQKSMGIFDFQNALQHSFGLFRFHPNALRSDINPSGVEVEAKYTNGAFTGYDIMFNQGPSGSHTNKANKLSASVQTIGLDNRYNSFTAGATSCSLVVDGTKLKITSENGITDPNDFFDFDKGMPTILTAQPLSLNGGEMIVDIQNLYDGSTANIFNQFNFIGLTRCQRDSFKGVLDITKINPPQYNPNADSGGGRNVLGDFGVVVRGADKEISFVHLVNNSPLGNTELSMVELDINTTILQDTPKAKHRFDSTTYGVNGKKITHIGFVASGEVMEISLRNASFASSNSASDQFVVSSAPYTNSHTGLTSVGGSGTTITHSASLQKELIKPISQTCQTLYPKFIIGPYDYDNSGDATKRNQVILEQYEGLEIKATSLLTDDPAPYGGMAFYAEKPDYLVPSEDGFYDRQTDFYAWCMNDINERGLLLDAIDCITLVNRFNSQMNNKGELNYTTEGIASRFYKQFSSGGQNYVDFEPILILGMNEQYNTFKAIPNAKDALGFDSTIRSYIYFGFETTCIFNLV